MIQHSTFERIAALITTEVADHFGFDPHDLKTTRRDTALVHGRWAIGWLLRSATGASYGRIGRVINREQSVVRYGFAKLKAAEKEPLLREVVDIEKQLTTRIAAIRAVASTFWTPERDRVLKAYWTRSQKTDAEIANLVGCSENDVPCRAEALGLMSDEWPKLPKMSNRRGRAHV